MNENARRLQVTVVTTLTMEGVPTEKDLLDLASQLRVLPAYQVSDDEFERVIRNLKEALRIDMGLGAAVVENHVPWLMARKASIDPFFWARYRQYLLKHGYAPRVVSALDRVGDETLDLLGNPASNAGWPRRGLVMGDVQSGKTSNYTGLICKAADAGYRLIVLLTGTLESLRRQTQGRLDFGFVGLDSAGVVTRNKQKRDVGVGLINAARSAGVFTSTMSDFRVTTVNQLGFRLNVINEPVLLVVKKNKRILENLSDWLVTFNANNAGTIDVPMLMIDDEADNASVNTSVAGATAINAAIRKLLRVFPRSSYVGFTATPFANVFINPDTADEMLGNDLFPRDFIYALEAPTNYIGASMLFGEERLPKAIQEIHDAEPFFPAGHKADYKPVGLPDTLMTALREFILISAIMDGRPSMPIHRSMLVNVSHFTEVQNKVRDELDFRLKAIQLDIRNFAGLPPVEADRIPSIAALRKVWLEEFQDSGTTWEEVLKRLNAAAAPMEVRSVNQRSGAASLDYAVYGTTGLRVIAVGGNSLSRGLTLEGLCVSYFYRNTQMYDTLMQMGRWFGYRDGYVDLFRIWMTTRANQWYGYIAEASEELRREIRWMQSERLRPADFGLKVRSRPESLLITARNKMRDSQAVSRVVSVSHQLVETTRLYRDPSRLAANCRAAQRFLQALGDSGARRIESNRNPFWTEVAPSAVASLLEAFVGHPLNATYQGRDLAAFVRAAQDERMKTWDVVVPSGDGEDCEVAVGVKIKLQKRKLEPEDGVVPSLLVSGKKMRVGAGGVEKEGLSEAQRMAAEKEFATNPEYKDKKNMPDHLYRAQRVRPLLMIHFLEQSGEAKLEMPENTQVAALGLSFPDLNRESEMVTYRVNLVELRNILEADSGGDDVESGEEADEIS